MRQTKSYDNLPEACVQEAMKIIETDGIEHLSMREVSRRLGISHQAPYKHFPSRDHILAEILQRSFDDFANHMNARNNTDDPYASLGALGYAYLDYAMQHPLQYRLMFGMPLPDPDQHPQMMDKAQRAFGILRDTIQRMGLHTHPDSDALYVWSTMHGLATILKMQMFEHLAMEPAMVENAIHAVIERIGSGLIAPPDRDA